MCTTSKWWPLRNSVYSSASKRWGYHIYQSVWKAVFGEELACQAKGSERPISGGGDERQKDRCHVPKRISAVCSMFPQEDGLILCWVNNPGACLIQTTFPSSTQNPTVDLININPNRRCRVTIKAENAAGRGTESYIFNSASAGRCCYLHV